MTVDEPAPAPSPGRRSAMRRAGLTAAVLLLTVLIAVTAVWLNRRMVARQVLTSWLKAQGVDAAVSVERLEMTGFTGRIRIGDPARPDLTVDRVEVDYAVVGPWVGGAALGVNPSRVRLVRPVLRATWADNHLSMGRLDPIIQRFSQSPPRPDSRGPLVVVEQGRVDLDTAGGRLSVRADARIQDGKLMRLSAVLPSATLRPSVTGMRQGLEAVAADGLTGRLELTTTGDRMRVSGDIGADKLAVETAGAEGLKLNLVGDLPYPDLKARRGDGKALLDIGLTAQRLRMSAGDAAASGRGLNARVAFDGTTQGWIETFEVAGLIDADLRAAAVDGPGLSAAGVHLTNRSRPNSRISVGRQNGGSVRWGLGGDTRLEAAKADFGALSLSDAVLTNNDMYATVGDGQVMAYGTVDVAARGARFGDLALNGANGRVRFDANTDADPDDPSATWLTVGGALRAPNGRWPLFGPTEPEDVAELKAMKAALGDFALDVPGWRLTVGKRGVTGLLTAPARLTPANGGVLTFQPVDRPIYAAAPGVLGGGALRLVATRGEGLPEGTFDIPDWRLTSDGFQARLDGRASLDFDVARGLTVSTAGVLASTSDTLTYVLSRCLDFSAERLELGENDVTDLAGQACAAPQPFLTARKGLWTVRGAVKDVRAAAPFLAARVSDAEGQVTVNGTPAGVGLDAVVAAARIDDATTPRRFHRLSASGTARLESERWTGVFDLTSGSHPVAHVRLDHDGATQRGGVMIDTGDLAFTASGLQPADLTPLVVGVVASPVEGSVRFSGRFDWDPANPDGSSSGRLVIPGLDFTSPAGPVKGLKGTIDFDNLAPLSTPSGQTLTVDTLETVTPLTDLDVAFSVDKAALVIAGGEIQAAGGVVKIEPFSVPLDRVQPFTGTIVFDRVQLGQLVKGAGFDDKVDLDAVVSGRLPFTLDPQLGLTIQGGTLAAVQPGRLSIRREALTGLAAGGGGTEVPPSTVEDLAYQAMENLAFDTLSAQVDSMDKGRLRVLFAIKGRHDPPQHQELRLTLPELISRKFLNRTLPLPSDTGIDLTLDTTLNINQLVSDLLELNRARSGHATPPPTPTPATTPPTP